MARCRHRAVRICWILSRSKSWIRADFSTPSGFGSLAAECDPIGGASPDAGACLVGGVAGRISGPLGGATAKQRSADDDFLLVHQQFLRGAHRRGLCPISDRSSGAVRSSGERRNFYFLRGVFGAFPFFL